MTNYEIEWTDGSPSLYGRTERGAVKAISSRFPDAAFSFASIAVFPAVGIATVGDTTVAKIHHALGGKRSAR